MDLPLASSSVDVFRGGELGFDDGSNLSAMCVHDGVAFGESVGTTEAVGSLLAGKQS